MKRKEGSTDHFRKETASEVYTTGTKPYACLYISSSAPLMSEVVRHCNMNNVRSKDAQKQWTQTVLNHHRSP